MFRISIVATGSGGLGAVLEALANGAEDKSVSHGTPEQLRGGVTLPKFVR